MERKVESTTKPYAVNLKYLQNFDTSRNTNGDENSWYVIIPKKFYVYLIKLYWSSGESDIALAVNNLEWQQIGHFSCSKRIH